MSRTDTATAPAVKTVPVLVNRRKLELPGGPMKVADLLERAGFEGTEWDILELQGEGDPSGGVLLLADATIEIKPGLHFRVLPGNRTFGASRSDRPKEPPEGMATGASA